MAFRLNPYCKEAGAALSDIYRLQKNPVSTIISCSSSYLNIILHSTVIIPAVLFWECDMLDLEAQYHSLSLSIISDLAPSGLRQGS
jgi:hypothetical protein